MSWWQDVRYMGLFAVVIAACLGLSADAPAAAMTGNANFFLGMKTLDKDDWEPVEDQAAFGAEVTLGLEEWPVHIAIDVFGSADEEDAGSLEVRATTSELDFGVRKIWDLDGIHPYVGGGLALVRAEAEVEMGGRSADDDDNALGAWVGGGVFWRLGSRFNLGVSLRYSKAEVTLGGVDVEAGGLQGGLLLGFGWPGR